MIILLIGTSNAGKTTFIKNLQKYNKKIISLDGDEIVSNLQSMEIYKKPNINFKEMAVNIIIKEVHDIFVANPKAVIIIPDISTKYINIFSDKIITTILLYAPFNKLIYNSINRPLSEGGRDFLGIIRCIVDLYDITRYKTDNYLISITYADLVDADFKIFHGHIEQGKKLYPKCKTPIFKSQAHKYAKMLKMSMDNENLPIYLTPKIKYDYIIKSSKNFDKMCKDLHTLIKNK
jgi:hypothetical protein